MLAFFLTHLWQTEYDPAHGAWYTAAIWGNLFVVPVAFLLGSLVWPPTRKRLHRFVDRKLAPLHAKMDAHHDEHAESLAQLHASLADLHRKHDELSTPRAKVKSPPLNGV
jgi:hypothetical protein